MFLRWTFWFNDRRNGIKALLPVSNWRFAIVVPHSDFLLLFFLLNNATINGLKLCRLFF